MSVFDCQLFSCDLPDVAKILTRRTIAKMVGLDLQGDCICWLWLATGKSLIVDSEPSITFNASHSDDKFLDRIGVEWLAVVQGYLQLE